MTPDDVRQLFDYNAWANQRALDSAAQLSDQEFVKPRGSSFSSLRDTLVHISSAEWIWLERKIRFGNRCSIWPIMGPITADRWQLWFAKPAANRTSPT